MQITLGGSLWRNRERREISNFLRSKLQSVSIVVLAVILTTTKVNRSITHDLMFFARVALGIVPNCICGYLSHKYAGPCSISTVNIPGVLEADWGCSISLTQARGYAGELDLIWEVGSDPLEARRFAYILRLVPCLALRWLDPFDSRPSLGCTAAGSALTISKFGQ